jgi:hypothetical protein
MTNLPVSTYVGTIPVDAKAKDIILKIRAILKREGVYRLWLRGRGSRKEFAKQVGANSAQSYLPLNLATSVAMYLRPLEDGASLNWMQPPGPNDTVKNIRKQFPNLK